MNQDHQEKNEKKPLVVGNALAAILFLSLGVVNVVSANYFGSTIWFCLGAALLVLGNEATPWQFIPVWRRAVGLALLALGLILIATQIYADFQARN